MDANVDLQVWLDAAAAERQVIAPYVRTRKDAELVYGMRLLRQGRGGRAELRQDGRLVAPAGQAVPLGTMSVNPGPNDTCELELTVARIGEPDEVYVFACPRRP